MRRSLRDEARARAALDRLAWRGPDSQNLIAAGDWWLGVARLAITDAAADQPIADAGNERIVLFNGAVTSARAERARAGAALRTRNDAELALWRLATGGTPALTATSGHYALAILEPASDRLWFARDPFGEKPLYVLRDGARVIAFASTVAALQALGYDLRLDPDEVGRFLRFGFHFGPRSFTAGVTLAPDLHGAVADDGAVVAGPGPHANGPARSLAERIVDAVGRCAEAEVPVGLALSGGVDSACLAAALRRLGRSVPAYQFRARGAPALERERATRVAAHTGQVLRPVDGGPEVLRALPELTRLTGLPQGDPSVLAMHALARAARADGTKVLLSGEGADELWLGYRRHRAAAWLPARGLGGLPAPQLATGTGARFLRALAAADPYASLLAVAPPGFLDTVLARGARAAATLPIPRRAGQSALARAREVDRLGYLRFDLLPKLDTATMAAGIESRCPFLDPDVVDAPETTAADPRRLLGKRPLRAAFRADLPAEVFAQRKVGFALPLDRWWREDDWLAALLTEPRTLGRPHLDAAGVRAMLARHRAGRARLGHPLYLLVAFELYLRTLEADR